MEQTQATFKQAMPQSIHICVGERSVHRVHVARYKFQVIASYTSYRSTSYAGYRSYMVQVTGQNRVQVTQGYKLHTGASWSIFVHFTGSSLYIFVHQRKMLGTFWEYFGVSWPILPHPGAVLHHAGVILGPFWGHLRLSWLI